MATIVLGVVGNVIFPGIGGAIGAGLGSGIDSIVGSAIARRLLQKDAVPPDIRAQPGVDAGTPAPWIHGSAVRVPGTVMYMSQVRQVEIPGETKGKAEGVVAGYNYFVDVGIAWCRNFCGVDPVRKIWASGELIYSINSQFQFDIEVYSVQNFDRWSAFSTTTTDGKPFCNRNRFPTERKHQRDQEMLWLAIPGSTEDQLYDSLAAPGALAFTNVTIAGCLNATNNGTFFCTGLFKEDFQQIVLPGGLLHNVYRAVFRRCNILYGDPAFPCEPDPAPCDEAITEVVPEIDGANTITITAQIPNFSRYFTTIRNYTGDPGTPISTHSLPNLAADGAIIADPDIDGNTVPAYRGTCYTVIENLNITKWAGTLPQFEGQIRERNAATPRTAVDALLERAEAQTAIAIDTQPLDNAQTIILGFTEAGPTPPANRIKELSNLYDFESQEIQQLPAGAVLPIPLLQFTPQADLVEVVVPFENTSAREAGSPGRVHAKFRRSSKSSLPQEMSFDYSDIDRDFQPNSTSYTVQTAPVQNRQKLSTNIVMTPAEADLISRRLLWKVISFADSFEFEAPAEQLPIVEGDRVRLEFLEDGSTIRGRVSEKTRGENGLILVKGQIDDELSYEQFEGGGYVGPVTETIDFASAGEARVLDIAPLSAADDDRFGVYIGLQTIRNDLSVSYGVFASLDQINWLEVARFSNPATTGSATSVLAEPTNASNWDDTNKVTIRMYGPRVLESVTREEVESGLNLAFLGSEIIGFTTATLVDSPTNVYAEDYELSGLLRGRNDTRPFMADHEIDDQFVLLGPSGPGVGFIQLEPSRFQQLVYLRVAPAGVSVLDSGVAENEIVFVPNAETLRPYSVHGMWGFKRPNGDTCVFATTRTRVPFRLLSPLVPPFVETGPVTDYKADIYWLDTPTTFEFLRTVEACQVPQNQIAFEYTSAQQVIDLVDTGKIATPDPTIRFRFVIYRISDSIGNGREVEFCIEFIGVEYDGSCVIVP